MSLSTITKTVGTSLVAWQDIASAAQVISSAQDVSTAFAAAFNIQLGRGTGTAFTAGWPNVRIEASGKSSGNDSWIPVAPFQMAVGASIANTTFNGAIIAGATSMVVTSASNIAVGDILFLGDASAANYELARVAGVSGTTITFEEAVTNGHSNGALVTDQAEVYFPVVDLSAFTRVRAVVDNAGSGQAIRAQILMNLMTNISTS